MNVSDNVCGRGDSWYTMTKCNPCYRNLCYHAFGNEKEVVIAKEEGTKKMESSRPRPKACGRGKKFQGQDRGQRLRGPGHGQNKL